MPAITNATSVLALPAAAMPTTQTVMAATTTTLSTTLQAILSAANASVSVVLSPLQQRLQDSENDSSGGGAAGGGGNGGNGIADELNEMPHANVASIILSNFLPAAAAADAANSHYASVGSDDIAQNIAQSTHSRLNVVLDGGERDTPTFVNPLSIESLVASSAEDLSNFRDVTFDIFDDDNDLFGSPLAFDASENGLWNGRFVPPPPRPPFFVDEPILSDGLTTCDLCSWAMPTKSTFIFEGTIEKASELGWPLTLIIVSILSALVGAIIMITVVRCRRKKASNNRNETHVQWWSRHKRPHSSSGISGHIAGQIHNNNHLRRSNIYTAHPADSIRGMGQPSLSAASSLTAMTAMGVSAAIAPVPPASGPSNGTNASAAGTNATLTQSQQQQQQQQYYHPYPHHHHYHHPHQLHHQHHRDYDEYEHEYHQPQELHLPAAAAHQRRPSSSSSLSSEATSPSLAALKKGNTLMPVQMHQPRVADDAGACRWSNATMMMAS